MANIPADQKWFNILATSTVVLCILAISALGLGEGYGDGEKWSDSGFILKIETINKLADECCK